MADICKYGERSVSSRTNTPEFDEGYETAFGPSSDEIRTPKRTVYVYRGGRMVERGGEDDTGAYDSSDEARLHIVSDLYMDGTRTADTGEDIGSRRKRREYMERNGLSDMSDWKGYWAKKAKEREAISRGEDPTGQRRQTIGRALYEQSKRRK